MSTDALAIATRPTIGAGATGAGRQAAGAATTSRSPRQGPRSDGDGLRAAAASKVNSNGLLPLGRALPTREGKTCARAAGRRGQGGRAAGQGGERSFPHPHAVESEWLRIRVVRCEPGTCAVNSSDECLADYLAARALRRLVGVQSLPTPRSAVVPERALSAVGALVVADRR